MNAKSFFVVLMFILFGIILAGGALGDTDLTPDNGTTTTSSGAAGGNTVSGLAITGNISNSPCGSVYVVQPGDYLMKIARMCGANLNDLVAFNPDIVNPNLIYPNQKINIVILATLPPAAVDPVDPADVVVLPTAVPPTAAPAAATQTPPPPAAPAVAVKPGEMVPVEVSGFQPFTLVQIAIGKVGEDGQVVSEQITQENGSIKVDVEIPSRAQPGETWVVTITAEREPRTVIQSPQFTITQ